MSLAQKLANGAGGLQFVTDGAPGAGRLVRVPFYMTSAVTGFDAQIPGGTTLPGASGTTSLVSPVVLVAHPNTLGVSGEATFKTPEISWAQIRVVGFETSIQKGILKTVCDAQIVVSDLKIGGSANLFTSEDFSPAENYLAGSGFNGLREYPLLNSPNVAEVKVAVVATIAGVVDRIVAASGGWSEASLFSCCMVCEILQDDNYGAPAAPGPYAKKQAMVRRR